MTDPVFVTDEASPESAAPIVGLIENAAAVAIAHFDQLPAGEEASVYVTLTARTGYGTIPLGMWSFLRAADNSVTLDGATQEGTDG
ncbi:MULTISPECIES: hypothetical protein [unclassified Streptomyces]|uniref:hypothetical protein n=1 Tax=unclassified Streptomyces TaxID=2593676 RepID=UPI002256970D|nr:MULTISPECIES: hypothetical protein [unclassified Streptomyces]MCX4406448.1 hypothetical protein [Streptomyces sp. NBC_01764]MCX5189028.1 hypothetical protein [Streptomyces sp. NBC_00268]